MSVKYRCRHCGNPLGEIKENQISEYRLGFHFLTPEERRDIISYDVNGDITVRIVCDYCEQALAQNPELTLVTSPLQ